MANIYMVEDDVGYAGVVVKVLGSMGHVVEVETDPSQAINHLRQKKPDLILLDVMFPEDSFAGLELARTLNRDPVLKGTPILLLTAVNEKYSMGFSPLDIDNSFFPVSDFLDKSVDLDILKAKVTKMLGEKDKSK